MEILGASNLEQALNNFTVVIAKPIESVSRVQSPYNIETWYKFKVKEYLNRTEWPVCQECPTPPNAPAELLPLKEDEILISRPSGTVVIDGVKITSVESDYPPFSTSQDYLLFVRLDSSSRVGKITMSRFGVFTVSVGGAIKRLSSRDYPLAAAVEAQDDDALTRLKEKIRTRQR